MRMNIDEDLTRELFEYKDGKLLWREHRGTRGRAGAEAGSIDKVQGYRVIMINRKIYKAHRLVWLYHNGEFPENQIDHIDGNKLNNRIENLRDVTNAENHKNQRIFKNNTSGYMGVHWDKPRSKWMAQVMVDGKSINLGRFKDKEDAGSCAYAAQQQLGFHGNHGVI